MKKLSTSLFLLVLVCGFSAIAVSGEETPKETTFRAVIDKEGIQRVDIIGGSYFFKPNHVIVKVNVPVELSLRKESGVVPHDIVLKAPEAGIDFKESLSTEPKIVRFTPTKTGIYPFYCEKKLLFFESHREKGMKGTLEVTE